MSEHPENYEDVTVYGLDDDVEEQLLLAHNECTFIWSNKEGWPVGVIMSYIWRNGRFWLTASNLPKSKNLFLVLIFKLEPFTLV